MKVLYAFEFLSKIENLGIASNPEIFMSKFVDLAMSFHSSLIIFLFFQLFPKI